MIYSVFLSKKLILIFLLLVILIIVANILNADVPDYYTGLGQEYEVKYYSCFIKSELSNDYTFIDELPTVDLEFDTFYKVISNKKSKNKIIGAFYHLGKLKWALTYNKNASIIRIEKYDDRGELILDKHYTKDGKLFFGVEVGNHNIYVPYYNRKSLSDLRYVYAYITKGQGVEIIDRREITKWFTEEIESDCVSEKYYNPITGKMVRESVYEKSNKHLYDRLFYYTPTGVLKYSEYYTKDSLQESSFYIYEGKELVEIEYRGENDKGIVRKIFENNHLKTIISYFMYYLPEVTIDFDEHKNPISAIHNRYDSTFRLLKTHYFTFDNQKFKTEEVRNTLNQVYEIINYEYSNDLLTKMTRKSVSEGDDYEIVVNYNYDSEGNIIKATETGTSSASLTYVYDNKGQVMNVKKSSKDYQMIFYENSSGKLNVDVLNNNTNSGIVYNKEEKVIATKQFNSKNGLKSIITVSNLGTIIKYEQVNKDETIRIHFDNNKPSIFEKLSNEDGKPIYKEFYDEGGNKYKTISYDPENYMENFIEFDENGKIISEYRLGIEGNLLAKLFYDENEHPIIYEEYNTFGVIILFSVRIYDEKSARLLNYSVYRNFGKDGFKLISTQIYGKGEKPIIIFIFDDKTHLLSSVEFNKEDGTKRKFIWRKIVLPTIDEELYDYENNRERKTKYKYANTLIPISPKLKSKPFFKYIK